MIGLEAVISSQSNPVSIVSFNPLKDLLNESWKTGPA